jgi:hypothetical protein
VALGQAAGPRPVRRGHAAEPEARADAAAAARTPESVAAAIAQVKAELRALAALLGDPEPAMPAAHPKRRARVTTMAPLTGSLFPVE